jgi:hypothetical protein
MMHTNNFRKKSTLDEIYMMMKLVDVVRMKRVLKVVLSGTHKISDRGDVATHDEHKGMEEVSRRFCGVISEHFVPHSKYFVAFVDHSLMLVA